MSFVASDDQSLSIDEGPREVRMPRETGVWLTTCEHADEFNRVSMADPLVIEPAAHILMPLCNDYPLHVRS